MQEINVFTLRLLETAVHHLEQVYKVTDGVSQINSLGSNPNYAEIVDSMSSGLLHLFPTMTALEVGGQVIDLPGTDHIENGVTVSFQMVEEKIQKERLSLLLAAYNLPMYSLPLSSSE